MILAMYAATPPTVVKGEKFITCMASLHHKGLNWFTSVASLTGNNTKEVSLELTPHLTLGEMLNFREHPVIHAYDALYVCTEILY